MTAPASAVILGLVAVLNRECPDCIQLRLWLRTDAAVCPGHRGKGK